MIDLETFARRVAAMRRAQTDYFRTASHARLVVAKTREKAVDRDLLDILAGQKQFDFEAPPCPSPKPTRAGAAGRSA